MKIMKRFWIVGSVVALVLVAGATWTFAQDSNEPIRGCYMEGKYVRLLSPTETECRSNEVFKQWNDWNLLANRPADLLDGDNDTLAVLNCAAGQVAKYDDTTTSWVCADDTDTNTTYMAGTGLNLNGSEFSLGGHQHEGTDITSTVANATNADHATSADSATNASNVPWSGVIDVPTDLADGDNDTLYNTGSGLTLDAANAFHVDTSVVQARVNGTCAAGSSISTIGADGAVTCETDDVGTDTLASLTCEAGELPNWDGTAWVCATDLDTDTNTTYSAGSGLLLDEAADTFSLDSHTHAGTDITSSVANADHAATAESATAASSVPWSGVTDVPSNLADGDNDSLAGLGCTTDQIAKWNGTAWVCANDVDTDTIYRAGHGLALDGASNTFSIDSAGLDPNYVNTSGDTISGDLAVAGSIQVGDTATTCNSSTAGTLRWTGTALEVCTGSSWTTVVEATTGSTDADGDGYASDVDCDDADPSVNPGADEVVDGKDNDCDGAVDEPTEIVLYQGGVYNGALGGRSGADSICADSSNPDYPSGYANYHAFLSVDGNDELRDMPGRYGVPTDLPIHSDTGTTIATGWSDLLDGSIEASLDSAGVTSSSSTPWWSGSTDNGYVAPYTCNGWTSTSAGGNRGDKTRIDAGWISAGTAGCGNAFPVLCIAY